MMFQLILPKILYMVGIWDLQWWNHPEVQWACLSAQGHIWGGNRHCQMAATFRPEVLTVIFSRQENLLLIEAGQSTWVSTKAVHGKNGTWNSGFEILLGLCSMSMFTTAESDSTQLEREKRERTTVFIFSSTSSGLQFSRETITEGNIHAEINTMQVYSLIKCKSTGLWNADF